MIICLCAQLIGNAQDKGFFEYFQLGSNAYAEKNYLLSLSHFQKALLLRPMDPTVQYITACLYARNNKTDESLVLLKKVVSAGLECNIKNDSDLVILYNNPQFRELLKLVDLMKKPQGDSKVAFIIKDKRLIPESIAYDANKKEFYVGSLHQCKIIKVNQDGAYENFTSEKQDGLWTVIGIKVDKNRKVLWANTAPQRFMKDFAPADFGKTAIFKYDLHSKKLLKKYVLSEPNQKHLFNDLDISKDGTVYITDLLQGSVYKISPGIDTLEQILKSEELLYANGITLSEDENKLFVAHFSGIAIIDLATKNILQIRHSANMTLAGTDGLYFYQNSLIAIQTSQNRVNRYWLNGTLDSVINFKTIESNNPSFNKPTTGILVKNKLYYIANSQFESFDNKGNLLPDDQLKEIIILKAELKN